MKMHVQSRKPPHCSGFSLEPTAQETGNLRPERAPWRMSWRWGRAGRCMPVWPFLQVPEGAGPLPDKGHTLCPPSLPHGLQGKQAGREDDVGCPLSLCPSPFQRPLLSYLLGLVSLQVFQEFPGGCVLLCPGCPSWGRPQARRRGQQLTSEVVPPAGWATRVRDPSQSHHCCKTETSAPQEARCGDIRNCPVLPKTVAPGGGGLVTGGLTHNLDAAPLLQSVDA